MLVNFPPPPLSISENCLCGRWKWQLFPHLEAEEKDDKLSFPKSVCFCFDALKEELPPPENSRSSFARRILKQPFSSLGLMWASFALRSFFVLWGWGKELGLGFSPCLLPPPFLLAFFPSHCLFWWFMHAEIQDASGNPWCYSDAWRKPFCRQLLKLLLKSLENYVILL